jgi:hypothetical protein
MTKYYVRLTWHADETSHHDVTADTAEGALAAARKEAEMQGHYGHSEKSLAEVYQHVGTHNILAQREPAIIV